VSGVGGGSTIIENNNSKYSIGKEPSKNSIGKEPSNAGEDQKNNSS
jgi:hypothetical protein